MKYYKRLEIVDDKLISPYQNYLWAIGQKVTCPSFDATDKDCGLGLYCLRLDQLIYHKPALPVFEVSVGGKSVVAVDKIRFEEMTVLRPVESTEIKQLIAAEKLNAKLGYLYDQTLYPVNPLLVKPPVVTDYHIELLRRWASVRDSVRDSVRASVGDSVWDSVRASVGDSVWNSVRDSVRDSVRASVWASVGDSVWDSVRASVGDSVWASVWASVGDSVWAYIGSLFPGVKKWKYIDHELGQYPLQSAVDLWHAGLVPSFSGELWRLHAGPNMDIVWEGKI